MFEYSFKIVLVLWSHISFSHCGQNGTLSASVDSMRFLLNIESSFIESLHKYGEELHTKLETINSALALLRAENAKALENPERYLSIPTNTFSLVRRMRQDWVQWDLYVNRFMETENDNWTQRYSADLLPCRQDFAGAVTGMERLRNAYELSVLDFSSGNLNGRQYDTKLTSHNCFALGEELYSRREYSSAYLWLDAALRIYEDHLQRIYDVLGFSRLKVFKMLIEVLLQWDNLTDALNTVDVALTFYPNNTRFLAMKSQIQTQAITNISAIKKMREHMPTDIRLYHDMRLCRGEYSNIIPRMYCIYNTTTTPFLKLAPLKMELLSLDPYIVLFHDVLYDNEISEMQHKSRIDFEDAAIANINGRKMLNLIRTAKLAWLWIGLSELTERVFRRMEDMTGFMFDDTDSLQVQNYGLGGHYGEHYDYFNKSVLGGDRKASIMFYVRWDICLVPLNEVEQGGVTSFPLLNLSIIPQKGSAILWYNLNNRLEPDVRTKHTACPVLVGSKWVVNQWVHLNNQVFRLPCYDG